MPSVLFTDRLIAAVSTDGPRLELSDAGCSGLCLRVTAKGSKCWMLRYRSQSGRQTRHRLGEYPLMGLREARNEASRIRGRILDGADPALDARLAREEARRQAMDTFGKLLAVYWQACRTGEWQPKRKIKRQSTLDYEMRLSSRHIEPTLGEFPVKEITRSTVKGLLRDMAGRGVGAQTNRVQAIIRQVFNYAISEELVEANPAMGFVAFHCSKPRQRVWKDQELHRLWEALNTSRLRSLDGRDVHVGRAVRIALQLAILLMQRRTEIAGMALEELDLDQAVWLIPPERMKSDRPQQVPLPPFALRLIREAISLPQLPGDRMKGPVFPSPGDHTKPMNAEALTRAMDRLRDCIGVHDATVHDLRRTGSTVLTSERLRVSPFIRSKVLGHGSDAGGGAQVSSRHYDVNEYMTDKRAALTAWETLLLRIVGEPDDAGRNTVKTGIIRGAMFGLEVANDVAPLWPGAFRAE